MMGLGYLGSSSSSSSSNLSPLAPPFTVDRSNHNKPTLNSNPVSHFNDPSYGAPFTSSWSYSPSSTARQEFIPDSHNTAAVSSNDCVYMIPEPINPPTTHNWTGLNSNVKSGTHWSAVNPSPKPATDSFSYNLSEAKPFFYPPYASSVNNDDIPLVTLSKPGYELLSTSGLVLGDESSQVDYTGSLSGLEYKPLREGLWGGLPEGKHGKRMQSDDSFFSEEANIAASLAYKGYLNQGAYGADTLSKGKEDSSKLYHADMLRRENSIGPSINGKSDGASFSLNNHRLNPNEFSKGAPSFRAFPMFSESHPLVPSPEPPEEPWNIHKSYALYKKKFNMFDCPDDRLSPSTTKSSSLVIKPPAAFSTFSAQGTTSRNLEFGNVESPNVNDVVGDHKPSKEKELHLPQGLESKGGFLAPNQLSFQIGRTDEHTFVTPPSMKEDVSTKLSANDQLNFEFKARSSFQVPDINIPNVNTAENMKSTANSFEHFDHHNPAEDSPCWKGVRSTFGSPEAVSPQHPTKKLQTGNGVNQTDHSFNHSSISEYKEKSSGSILFESEAVGAKASSRGGTQTVHETIKTRKAHSDANSQTCQLKSPNNEEMQTQLPYGEVDHSVHAVERFLVSSMEDAATSKKVNASILVKALHNLSDLLFLHCSDDEYALKEQDQEAIDHVIANLNACMSRKVKVPPTNKLMLPLQNTSNMSQEVKNDTGHYQKQNSDSVEKSEECVSLRDEADDNMIQAIKKLLDENLECKEELPSKTLLYKNLWLEAEAELCSLNYRARFERMKRETNKPTVSDGSGKGDGMKKISSCNGFDLKIPPKLIEKDGSEHVQNHPFSGVDSRIDDAEASVMARFNILKLRGDLNSVDVAGVEASGKGSQSVQHDICKDENVEPLMMARLNILKRREEANGKGSGSSNGKFLYEANKAEAVGNESGWYSGSGSDWEHILKDEFSWQSNGRLT